MVTLRNICISRNTETRIAEEVKKKKKIACASIVPDMGDFFSLFRTGAFCLTFFFIVHREITMTGDFSFYSLCKKSSS